MQKELDEITAVLETTMSAVRAVSMEIAPSPVRALGLKGAMEELLERCETVAGIPILLRYKAGVVPARTGDAIYHSVELFMDAMAGDAAHASVAVSGTGPYTLRIRVEARGTRAKWHYGMQERAVLYAKTCCRSFTIEHGQVTIVTMHYAHQRPVG